MTEWGRIPIEMKGYKKGFLVPSSALCCLLILFDFDSRKAWFGKYGLGWSIDEEFKIWKSWGVDGKTFWPNHCQSVVHWQQKGKAKSIFFDYRQNCGDCQLICCDFIVDTASNGDVDRPWIHTGVLGLQRNGKSTTPEGHHLLLLWRREGR